MTTRIKISHLFIVFTWWSIFYWICAWYNLIYTEVIGGLNGACALASGVVVYRFAASIVRMRDKPVTGAVLIRFGIVLGWASQSFIAARILWFEYHRDMVLSIVAFAPDRGYLVLLSVLGAMLHILAIGMIDDQPLKLNMVLSGLSVIIGTVIGVGVILLAK